MGKGTGERADTRFNGRWVGETMGCDMPAHTWEIIQRDQWLEIRTQWEGEDGAGSMHGEINPGAETFTVGQFTAILVDPEHFLIPGWDTNDARGGVGPDYDVIFSRPGLAELLSTEVWLKATAKVVAKD